MRDTCRLIRCIFGILLLAGIVGCGGPPGYIFSATAGQLDFLSRAQPIEAALQDPALTDEQREKLAFVVQARDYAEDVIGLHIGNSYQEFVNLGDEPLAWNLSASRKDAFEPVIWSFPFIGSFPYLGFFDLEQAEAERDRLKEQDYDTMLYELDTYAIPVLADPITSAMLRRSEASLADTVMHELLHNTITRPDDTNFNESLATFVGREAAIQFLAHVHGEDTEMIDEAIGGYEDQALFHQFIADTVDQLKRVYSSDRSKEHKIAERRIAFEAARRRFRNDVLPAMNDPEPYEPFSEFPLNNAFLLSSVRYNDNLDLYADVHEATGGNWSETLAVFNEAAQRSDPLAYLRRWLADQENAP